MYIYPQPWIREESAHLRKGSQWLETFDQIVEECFIGDKDEEVSYSRQLRLSEAAYRRECSK